jgi:predicted DNA-binding transcriptional regulator AlpA
MRRHDEAELGPLFTVTEEELSRPARRREDRDVLVLRIEIEAQRREVARLMKTAGEKLHVQDSRIEDPPEPDRQISDPDKLLLSARDLRKALGVSAGTLYRWMGDGTFPPQIHIGSLARWRRADIDAWIQARTEARAMQDLERTRPSVHKKVRGGRSRWASTAQVPVVTESNAPAWEPQPTPLRGTGHRLAAGVPVPVAPDHPDYQVPRFSREHAAQYVGLPWSRQWDLHAIPHGRTRAMHYCFAQSDLDDFKSTLKPARGGRRRGAKEP